MGVGLNFDPQGYYLNKFGTKVNKAWLPTKFKSSSLNTFGKEDFSYCDLFLESVT